MKNGISEMIGQAVFGDGARGTAYRALRPLVCASCGALVAEGEVFTRDRASGQSLRLWPRCQACVPFALDAGPQTRSALLQSLLTPTESAGKGESKKSGPQEPAANDERPQVADARQRVDAARRRVDDVRGQVDDERERIEQAMRRRLGPALERMRRLRSGGG